MHLNISQRVPISRDNLSDFIVPIVIDVLASSGMYEQDAFDPTKLQDQQEDGFLVGRLWAERWDLSLCEECGHELLLVADTSNVWMQVAETLIKGRNRFRPELGIQGYISEIVFLHQFLLHPEIDPRVAVIDSMIRSSCGANSLVLTFYEKGADYCLADSELHELGFCKIARSNLLLKDTSLRYPFGDKFPAGKMCHVRGTLEHEQWLVDNWNKLLLDHS